MFLYKNVLKDGVAAPLLGASRYSQIDNSAWGTIVKITLLYRQATSWTAKSPPCICNNDILPFFSRLSLERRRCLVYRGELIFAQICINFRRKLNCAYCTLSTRHSEVFSSKMRKQYNQVILK